MSYPLCHDIEGGVGNLGSGFLAIGLSFPFEYPKIWIASNSSSTWSCNQGVTQRCSQQDYMV